MSDYQKWVDVMPKEPEPRPVDWTSGPLRVTLLFGGFAVAMALLAVPLLESDRSTRFVDNFTSPGIDYTATGTPSARGESFVVRRSVLQPTPQSSCVIRSNGIRTGDC
ncbi:MAG: hypothetical protein AAFO77_00280 [Pseudomonadota bacterium]